MNQQQRKYFCNCVDAIAARKKAKLVEQENKDVAAVMGSAERLLAYLVETPAKAKEELYKTAMAVVKHTIDTGRGSASLDLLPYSYRQKPDIDDFKPGNDCIKKYNEAVENVRKKYATLYNEIRRQAEELKHRSMFCDMPDEIIDLLHKFDDGGVTEDDMEEGGLK